MGRGRHRVRPLAAAEALILLGACTDPEELRLILRTLSAQAFNFAKADVGVHTVVMQARAQAAVNFDDDASGGALAGAEAFTGAGSLVVDEVRLLKGQDITFDLP